VALADKGGAIVVWVGAGALVAASSGAGQLVGERHPETAGAARMRSAE
jgi:hypothetical protein